MEMFFKSESERILKTVGLLLDTEGTETPKKIMSTLLECALQSDNFESTMREEHKDNIRLLYEFLREIDDTQNRLKTIDDIQLQ